MIFITAKFRVRPEDADRITKGMTARINFSSYHQRRLPVITGTVETAVVDSAGHSCERPHRIDRVEMAEEQDRFAVPGAREIDLEIVTVLFRAVEVRASTEGGELFGEDGAHTVGGDFVVAG